MADTEWLENLKPGDTVVVDNGYCGRAIKTVDRITATQIVVGKQRFRKADGLAVGESGGGWRRCCIQHATPKAVAEVTTETLLERLTHIQRRDIESLPTETLQQAWELLKGGRSG